MLRRKNTTVALKTVKRVRKLLWSPIAEPSTKSLWSMDDMSMNYDREMLREKYVKMLTTKSVKKQPKSSCQDLCVLPSILDPKVYQRLVVCLKGLRLTDAKIEMILNEYNHLHMKTRFGQLWMATLSSAIPQQDELRLVCDALPDFSVTNYYQQKVYNQPAVRLRLENEEGLLPRTITDWLDYRLMDIESKYPYLRFNLNLILKRYEVETALARICTRIVELYHFILSFDECYLGNIVPLLHTVRSIGNALNEGTYLGNTKGVNLSSLKLFLNHKSVDKQQDLVTELRRIVKESGIDYDPLLRFYLHIRKFDNLDEIYNDYRDLNSTITTTPPLAIASQFGLGGDESTNAEGDGGETVIVDVYRHYLKFQQWLLFTRVAIEDRLRYVKRSLRSIEQKLGCKDVYLLKEFIAELFQLNQHKRDTPSDISRLGRLPRCCSSPNMHRSISEDQVSIIDLLVDLPSSQNSSTPSTVDMLENRSSPSDDRPSPTSACTACEFEALFFMLNETGGLIDLRPTQKSVVTGSVLRLFMSWLQAMLVYVLAKVHLAPVSLASEDLSEWGTPITPPPAMTPTANAMRKVNFNNFVLAHMCTPQPQKPKGNFI